MPPVPRSPERNAASATVALLAGCMTAFMAACLALRTLAVELSLPAEMRLDELRLFAVAQSRPARPWLAKWAPDPLRVHARYAACKRQADPRRCLAAVEDALAQAPANGRLWLEKAKLDYGISGPSAAFQQSLAASWKTAPRAGWIARERLRFAASVWPDLAEEARHLAASDAFILASANSLAAAFGKDYARQAPLRPAMAEIITDRLPEGAQRRLISAMKQAVP